MELTRLVEQAQSGCVADYEELVKTYQRLAVMWSWKIVHDIHIAQDVAQDAFVIGYRKIDTLKDPASFPSWLAAIVRRQAFRYLGKLESGQPLDYVAEPAAAKGPDPEWLERHSATVQAIKSLPQHEQDVVVLHYLEGHATPVVSQLLDRPVGTVTKQLSRAIKRLQGLLVEGA